MDDRRILRAFAIASIAHRGQTRADKERTPYIQHPRYLMNQMETESGKICAVLHDVVEDTKMTMEDLIARVPLTAEEAEVLELLTHKKEDSYDEYISKIKTNELATAIKIEDLKHNSMTLDGSNFSEEKKAKLISRYVEALRRLVNKGEQE